MSRSQFRRWWPTRPPRQHHLDRKGVAAFDASVLAPEDSSGDIYPQMRILIRCWWVGALIFLMAACSAQNGGGSGGLKVGMTTDQAIEAMGKPDLTDSIPDPDHAGAPMLRYTWLNAGEAAAFGQNMRVANVVNVGSSPETLQEAARQPGNGYQPAFDPIQTPFDYAF